MMRKRMKMCEKSSLIGGALRRQYFNLLKDVKIKNAHFNEFLAWSFNHLLLKPRFGIIGTHLHADSEVMNDSTVNFSFGWFERQCDQAFTYKF